MTTIEIGERIRTKRKERGLSQQELAELASLNYVTVSKYESGKVEPGAKALTRIANALDVTTDVLLGRKEEITGSEPNQATPHTLEARIVSFGMDQLPPEERNRIVSMLQVMYSNKPELFKRGVDNDPEL